MFRRTTLLALLAVILPAVGVAHPGSGRSPPFVEWPSFCPPGVVGVLRPASPAALFGALRPHEVVSLTDTLVHGLQEGGIRLPPIVTDARVRRSGHFGNCYMRPLDVTADLSLWVLDAALTPAPAAAVAARGRFAAVIELRQPCGAGALELTILPGIGGIGVTRRVSPGRTLVCEDPDQAGMYRVTERSKPGAEGEGYCEWTFDLPGGPLPVSKGGDPGYPGGPPVPLTELLASGRPAFEAFASIQQTVCGEPPSP